MAKIEDTIASLELKLKQAKALKQKQEAQKKAKEQKLTRAQDTRRKILLGSFLLEQCKKNEIDFALVTYENASLDKFLIRPDDRALFQLPAASSPAADKAL
jgi:hypothetical protein